MFNSNQNQINYRDVAKQFELKLKKIKVVLLDVDGILTDGRLFYAGSEIGFNRFFHAHDGYGIKVLREAGLKVGIVSGKSSVSLDMRASDLKLDYKFVGNSDKRDAWEKIKGNEFTDSEILYMGDEFFDMPLLKRAGFSATVPSASMEVREVCDYVTNRNSGEGCVREVIDLLRYVQGIVPDVPDFE